VAHIEGESASYFYKSGFFTIGTFATWTSAEPSGFATVITTSVGLTSGENYGTLSLPINSETNKIYVWSPTIDLKTVAVGSYFRCDNKFNPYEEIMEVLDYSVRNESGITSATYTVHRARFDTPSETYPSGNYLRFITSVPYSTFFGITSSLGTSWRWF
jgi:hypothetical protein